MRATFVKLMPNAAVIALIVAFALVSLRWILLYRGNLLLDVDEAGYLRMAFNDYRVLSDQGILAWLRAVFGPGLHSPLMPAAASLAFLLLHPSASIGIFIALIAGCGAIWATYLLALRLSSDRLSAFCCALLVASCPAIVVYARSFHFSLPATFLLVLALWAASASDNFKKFKFCILFGVLVGLLPLTRTMTIAFLPGLLAGSAITALVATDSRASSLRGMAAAAVVAVFVAATWFLSSAANVFQYLLSFGYGARAKDYGPQSSVFEIESWIVTLGYAKAALFALHFLFAVFGTVCGALLILRYTNRWGFQFSIKAAVKSKYFPILFTVIAGLAALTSTSNKGSAYMLPLLPLMLILSGLAFFKILHQFRMTGFVCVAVLSAVAFTPMVDLRSSFSNNRIVSLPLVGKTPITDGAGTFELYYVSIMGRNSQLGDPVPPKERKRWIEIFGEIDSYLKEQKGKSIAFGFRHFLLTANHIPFQLDLTGEPPRAVMQLDPFQLDGSEAAYLDSLRTAQSCILMMAEGARGDFPPPMDGVLVRNAALKAGFVVKKMWSMPGDRQLELLQREDC